MLAAGSDDCRRRMTGTDTSPALPQTPTRRSAARTDELAAAPTRLLDDDGSAGRARRCCPGWTRGHVLTHLARNADAFPTWCWPPGPAAAGGDVRRRTRPATRTSRPGPAAPRRPAAGPGRVGRAAAGGVRRAAPGRGRYARGARCARRHRAARLSEIPAIRIREVEIHHVDLAVGYTPDDWPRGLLARRVEQRRRCWPRSRRAARRWCWWLTDARGRWEVGGARARSSPARGWLAWLAGRPRRRARGLTAPPATAPGARPVA